MAIRIKHGSGITTGAVGGLLKGSADQSNKMLDNKLQNDLMDQRSELDQQKWMEREKQSYAMKSDTEKAHQLARKEAYDQRVNQINIAKTEGIEGKVISPEKADEAMKWLQKTYEDVSDPYFSEITKEEDPVFTAEDGTTVPINPDHQKAWALHREFANIDRDKKMKSINEKIKIEMEDSLLTGKNRSDAIEKRREELMGQQVDQQQPQSEITIQQDQPISNPLHSKELKARPVLGDKFKSKPVKEADVPDANPSNRYSRTNVESMMVKNSVRPVEQKKILKMYLDFEKEEDPQKKLDLFRLIRTTNSALQYNKYDLSKIISEYESLKG